MADRLRVACVQINSSPSKAENLERMEPLVARAAATGADLVLLPEKWNGLGSHEILLEVAEPLEGGETVEAMSGWARTHGITLVGGSIAERREGREKLSNTCVVFDPEGEHRRRLPQDPHVRRRGRRGRLPRVGERGAGRRAGQLRGRGLDGSG